MMETCCSVYIYVGKLISAPFWRKQMLASPLKNLLNVVGVYLQCLPGIVSFIGMEYIWLSFVKEVSLDKTPWSKIYK